MAQSSGLFQSYAIALILLCLIQTINGFEDNMTIEPNGQKVPFTQSKTVLQLDVNTNFHFTYNTGVFSIEVSDIQMGQNLKENQPFRLLAIVTSEKVDTSEQWKHATTDYKGKYSADLDGFATFAHIQNIKHIHQAGSPLIITIYLVNIESDSQDSLQGISAKYSVSIQEMKSNECLPSCQAGTCDEQQSKCICPLPALNSMYFDRTCSDQAILLAPGRETIFITEKIKTFFYIDLQDISRGCSLSVNANNPQNQISFLVYQEGKGTFSTPNLLVDSVKLDSKSTKQFFFPRSWLQQAQDMSKSSTNPSLKIILTLYNIVKFIRYLIGISIFCNDYFKSGVETSFRIVFYDTGLGVLLEQIPEWAIYFVSILLIVGIMLIASSALTIIRNRIGGNTTQLNANPNTDPPLTQAIIEKYMPAKPFSEVKNDITLDSQECTICLERYEDTEKVRISMCGHLFHMGCIDEWVKKHASCPYCRHGLKEIDMKKGMSVDLKQRINDQNNHNNQDLEQKNDNQNKAGNELQVQKIQNSNRLDYKSSLTEERDFKKDRKTLSQSLHFNNSYLNDGGKIELNNQVNEEMLVPSLIKDSPTNEGFEESPNLFFPDNLSMKQNDQETYNQSIEKKDDFKIHKKTKEKKEKETSEQDQNSNETKEYSKPHLFANSERQKQETNQKSLQNHPFPQKNGFIEFQEEDEQQQQQNISDPEGKQSKQ